MRRGGMTHAVGSRRFLTQSNVIAARRIFLRQSLFRHRSPFLRKFGSMWRLRDASRYDEQAARLLPVLRQVFLNRDNDKPWRY